MVRRRVQLAWSVAMLATSSFAAERASRVRTSANGQYGIRMIQPDAQTCRLEVVKESALVWKLEQCVGDADDLYFVSGDAERFWVLKTVPELVTEGKAVKRSKKPPLLSVLVAVLYDKTGAVLQRHPLGDFIRARDVESMRLLGRHFKWLAGVVDVPGTPPRLNDKDEVELETLAGTKTHKLDFST